MNNINNQYSANSINQTETNLISSSDSKNFLQIDQSTVNKTKLVEDLFTLFLKSKKDLQKIDELEDELEDLREKRDEAPEGGIERRQLLEFGKKIKQEINLLNQINRGDYKKIVSIETEIEQLLNPKRELPVQFSRINSLQNSDSDLLFLKNLLFSKLKLWDEFASETRVLLETNKAMIINNFSKVPVSNSNEVKINFSFLGGDDHNKGKSPVKVSLTLNDLEICKVVYKPRAATTDRAILELFSKLNQLPPDLKTGPDLPFFRVEEINQGKGSIWEFIEGQHLKEEASATLDAMEADNPIKKAAAANLMRLEQVCHRAGISDLHLENVFLTDQGKWVLIDLEVVELGQDTGLIDTTMHPNYEATLPELSSAEQAIISQFLQEQADRASRFVIMATAKFTNASTTPEKIRHIADDLVNILHKTPDLEMKLADQAFKERICNTMDRGDVPFFTKTSKALYFGEFSPENLIAQYPQVGRAG